MAWQRWTVAKGGQELTIEWRDGVLGGDRLGAALIEATARGWDGYEVGPPGGIPTVTAADHLASASSVAEMVRDFADRIVAYETDIPSGPPPPAGAVE